MRATTRPVQDLRTRIANRAFKDWKRVYQLVKGRPNGRKSILLIVGCQRSGTTLMQEIFERELNAQVYGEFSELSSMDEEHGIRLNPLDMVKRVIDRDRAPLVVLKPLVETQNIHELLGYFPDSRALFLYRDYRDVASSIIKKFGAQSPVDDLRPIVARDPQNWRSENVSERVRDVVVALFSESMSPADAAALVWWVRSSLYFDLDLEHNPAVMLCKYEELAAHPKEIMSRIYRFAGVDFEVGRNVDRVHAESVAKGKGMVISPQIERLCDELRERLDRCYSAQTARSR